jgi:hypothetical protein
MQRPTLFVLGSLSLTILLGAGCAAPTVQAYEGAKLPDDKVTYLWTNPHLDMSVDRSFTVTAEQRSTLQRIELRTGHHVAEVSCLYTDDVTYQPKEGASAPRDKAYTQSPAIALTIDGEPGHSYKPVVHYELGANGVPGCHVKAIDVTDQSGAEKTHLY